MSEEMTLRIHVEDTLEEMLKKKFAAAIVGAIDATLDEFAELDLRQYVSIRDPDGNKIGD